MPLQGAEDVVPLLGAIVGCLVGVVPLQGVRGEGDDQLCGRGAIAGCERGG